ncbi:NAD(+)/NADH kinase [Helicobacter sp. MIT 14-3879]|uniref:NAD(+)/NADH kinase n=1 Tax=Helicobacter sp. MIT 14-3879 TaxID=2040649 RepID=UPI000E1ED47A|nr:NAD(+)/NADH kinase [Helicobacter sp. MIT 14-3879]RDU64151.1 NAD(+) kinase [Helicobacter sp. MIT 14-3879]
MLDINKIGVILRPSTLSLYDSYLTFKKVAQKYDIYVEIDKSHSINVNEGLSFNELCEWSDVLVSIGGDGTLISLIRRSISYNKPIFGINMGRLGFLTSVKLNEIDSFLMKLKNNDYSMYSHMLLEGEFVSNNVTKKLFCVNEFLISRQIVSGMIKIISKINGKYFNTYLSDGLIIGTPTGSSAYNISAGGAIVYPYNRNILLTPICAHSLTQKPLILNDEFNLEFSVDNCMASIIIDGQDIINFNKFDTLKVFASKKSALLIYDKQRDYFEVLREKFGWGL